MLLSLTQHGLYEKNCRDFLCAIVFGFNNDFKRVKSSELEQENWKIILQEWW